MNKTLEVIMKNAAGTKKTINIPLPDLSVTYDVIKTAMNKLIEISFFKTTGGDLVELVEARYKTVSVEPIA